MYIHVYYMYEQLVWYRTIHMYEQLVWYRLLIQEPIIRPNENSDAADHLL